MTLLDSYTDVPLCQWHIYCGTVVELVLTSLCSLSLLSPVFPSLLVQPTAINLLIYCMKYQKNKNKNKTEFIHQISQKPRLHHDELSKLLFSVKGVVIY